MTPVTATQDSPGASDGKASVCLQCGRPRFNPWVGKIPWKRKWQSAPVLLIGKSHRQRSLVGYSPWGRKEWDTTERLHFPSPFSSIHTTGKTIALARRTFVGKALSLLSNMPSGLVTALLPRRKCLLMSWLQSPSAVILNMKLLSCVRLSATPWTIAYQAPLSMGFSR